MRRRCASYPRYGRLGPRAVSRPTCLSAATTPNARCSGRLTCAMAGACCCVGRTRARRTSRPFLRHLRHDHYRGGQPLWLLVDKAPCHVAAGSLTLAAALNITLLWLPRQCSELNAMDHLWRHLKADLAANRQRPNIDALAEQAETWVLALSPQQTLRKAGLLSKNCWLKHVRTNFCLG